jgi:hypothetical protein
VCYYDLKAERFSKALLNGTICFSVCKTIEGDILIGTDEGLFVGDTSDVQRFTQGGGLHDKSVKHIAQSPDGDIWCATSSGIWQYDSDNKTFIAHINGNGLFAKEYFTGGLTTNDGRQCFISTKGLTVFDPIAVSNRNNDLPDVKIQDSISLANTPPQASQTSKTTIIKCHTRMWCCRLIFRCSTSKIRSMSSTNTASTIARGCPIFLATTH